MLFTSQREQAGLEIIVGSVLGFCIVFGGTLANKWAFAIVCAGLFPLMVIALCSLKRAMEAVLILSFSMVVKVHLGYTEDPYLDTVRTGIPITLSMLCLAGLYVLWAWRIYRRVDELRVFPRVSIPLMILFMWAGLSSLWAPRPEYAVYNLFGLVEMLAVFIYAANSVKSTSDAVFIGRCAASTVIISAVVAMVQYATNSSLGLEFLGTQKGEDVMYILGGASRAGGFLGHANGLSWFLTQWLPMLLLLGVIAPPDILDPLCSISFVLGVIALLLTFSRAGWLAFTISLLLILGWLLTKNSRRQVSGALGRFLLVSLVLFFLALPFSYQIKSRIVGEDENAAYSRVPLALVAVNVIRHNLIFGVGSGNYEYVMQKYDNTPEQIETPETADSFPVAVHNVYLYLSAELGIFALILYTYIMTYILSQCGRLLKTRDRKVLLFGVAVIIGIAAFSLQGMFQPGGIGTTRFRPFWFMCGLVISCSRYFEDSLKAKAEG